MAAQEATEIDTRLHTAKDQKQVRKLLQEGVNPNGLDDKGNAPIHVYVRRKDKKVSECLVTLVVHSQCDLDLPDSQGKTALHIAVELNDIVSAKILLAFGAEVNCLTPNDLTPVDIVQENWGFHAELLTLLVSLGGVIHQAVINDHLIPFRQLTNAGALQRACDTKEEWRLGAGATNKVDRKFKPGSFEPEKGVFDSSEVETSTDKRGEKQVRFVTDSPDQDPTATMRFSVLTLRKVQPFIEEVLERESAESSMHSWIHVEGETTEESGTEDPLPLHPGLGEVQRSGHSEASDTPRPKKLPLERSGSPLTDAAYGPYLSSNSQGELVRSSEIVTSGSISYAAWQQFREKRRIRREEGRCRGRLKPMGSFHGLLPTPTNTVRRDFEWSSNHPLSPSGWPRSLGGRSVGSEDVDSTAPVAFRAKSGDRVLCLDGGGMKGLVQIEILMELEEVTERKVTDLFDWIVGTSTGGVLALGLVYAKLSLEDLQKLYFDLKDEVFRKPTFGYRCDSQALEKLLKERLGETTRMNECTKPKVMITAVNKRTTDLKLVWFNNCFDDEYSNELVWRVARATSAAPVFFTEFDGFVDGGVKANNPCEHALTKIQSYLDTDGRKVACMVSVGCGRYPPSEIGDADVMRVRSPLELFNIASFFRRARNLLTLLLSSMNQDEETAENCKSRCERQNIEFIRLSPFLDHMVMPTENNSIVLCEIILKAKELLHAFDAQMGVLVEHLYHLTLQHEAP